MRKILGFVTVRVSRERPDSENDATPQEIFTGVLYAHEGSEIDRKEFGNARLVLREPEARAVSSFVGLSRSYNMDVDLAYSEGADLLTFGMFCENDAGELTAWAQVADDSTPVHKPIMDGVTMADIPADSWPCDCKACDGTVTEHARGSILGTCEKCGHESARPEAHRPKEAGQ